MAISPEISLAAGKDTPIFNPFDAATKGANLATLMQNLELKPKIVEASIESTKAGTVGQNLLNAQTQRDQATRLRLAELAKDNSTVDKSTGKIRTDYGAVANQASSEGFDPDTVFGYLKKGTEQIQNDIKTNSDSTALAAAQYKHTTDVLSSANNLIRVQKDPQRAAQIMGGAVSIISPVIGADQAKTYASQYWSVPADPSQMPKTPDGKPDVAALGTHLIQQSDVNSKASISPQQAIANKQTEESLRQGREGQAMTGAGSITSPEARDPTSNISRQAQSDYLAANPTADRGRVIAMSAADIQHLTGPAGVVAANIVPASTKSAAVGGGQQIENQARILDDLSASAAKVPSKFGGLTIANILQGKFDQKLWADPAFNDFATRVQQAQTAGIPLDTSMGASGISKIAAGQAATLRKQSSGNAALATSPTFNAVPQTTAPTPQTVSTTQVGSQKQFTTKDGKSGMWVKIKAGPDNDRSTWAPWK